MLYIYINALKQFVRTYIIASCLVFKQATLFKVKLFRGGITLRPGS